MPMGWRSPVTRDLAARIGLLTVFRFGFRNVLRRAPEIRAMTESSGAHVRIESDSNQARRMATVVCRLSATLAVAIAFSGIEKPRRSRKP